MISHAFINGEPERLIGSDPFLMFEKSIEDEIDRIGAIIKPVLEMCQTYAFESGFLGEDVSDLPVTMEAGSKNVFSKIGESIIAMGKKLIELINKVIGKVTGSTKKAKKQQEDIDKILKYFKKNDPKEYAKIKDDIIAEFEAGTLSPSDARSIKDFRAAYDELEKMAKDAKIDPKTFRGKIELFKKKFDKIDQSRVVKTANAGKVVFAAIAAPASLVATYLLLKKNLSDDKDRISKKNQEYAKAYDEILRIHGGEYVGWGLSKGQLFHNLHLWMMHKDTKMIRQSEGAIAKLESKTDGWIGKMLERMTNHMKANRNNAVDQFNSSLNRMRRAEEEQTEKEAQKERIIAAARALGTQDGNYQATQGDDAAKHRALQQDKIDVIKKETKARLKAQGKYEDKNQDKINERERRKMRNQDEYNNTDYHQFTVRRTAENQERGRLQATRP